MDIYLRKKRWKWLLFGTAVVIVSISLYYTNILVGEIRKDERKNVQIWADAIHHRAGLVNYTNKLFEQVKDEERLRMKTVAETHRRMITANISEDLTFESSIVENNVSIPVIVSDEKGNIQSARNVDFNTDTVPKMTPRLTKEFSLYPPIVESYNPYNPRAKLILYYKDSKIFTDLRKVLDDLVNSFFSEVVLNSASVPVIITDSLRNPIREENGRIVSGNIPAKKMEDPAFVRETIESMAAHNKPIRVNLAETGVRYIYYEDSFLLTKLRYYPYVQLAVISLFLLIAYLLFSQARRSEQNQVWVGMAKETAHQLGTPLSSMMAWVELLKLKGVDQETLNEIEKDVNRLETITDRFSKIGSQARLESSDIVKLIYDSISYIRSRISQKVHFTITPDIHTEIMVPLNIHLFEWVIENLCKNAVDAMEGNGEVNIDISEDETSVFIDVSDSGKGIPKSRFKTIFNPGYTSKKRGWGLGLTLSRRIIENYHSGKIFVRSSVLNKGTTFRIILKKKK
ncbi:MAG: HAMP domain-containing sensor histidine kinase [Bacteroidetes bacterium]|nr:HAMP domain-containing sensor histidine kinase [Bacteroidota bacterium]